MVQVDIQDAIGGRFGHQVVIVDVFFLLLTHFAHLVVFGV